MSGLGVAVKTHLHHVFPQQFFVDFQKLGIDVDDFVMKLTARMHIGKGGVHLKGKYNGRWQDFFDEAEATGRKLTKADAEAYLAEILNDLGLETRWIGSMKTGRIWATVPSQEPTPSGEALEEALAQAQKNLKEYMKLSKRARAGQKGFVSIGELVFVLVAVGSVVYAISNADTSLEAVKAAGEVAEDLIGQLVVQHLAYKATGVALVGGIVGLVLGMSDDRGLAAHEEQRKREIAIEFIRKRIPGAVRRSTTKFLWMTYESEEFDPDLVDEAYDLLFNTPPIIVDAAPTPDPQPSPLQQRAPQPAPAAPVWRTDYPPPPPLHTKGKVLPDKVSPDKESRKYPLPPPIPRVARPVKRQAGFPLPPQRFRKVPSSHRVRR